MGAEGGEGVIAMTTTGAQYALAASTRANNGGSNSATVGVEPKPSVVVVTTSSSSGSGSAAQSQSTRGQQLITVVTSPDPSSPNNLQPIQVCCITLCRLLLFEHVYNYIYLSESGKILFNLHHYIEMYR